MCDARDALSGQLDLLFLLFLCLRADIFFNLGIQIFLSV